MTPRGRSYLNDRYKPKCLGYRRPTPRNGTAPSTYGQPMGDRDRRWTGDAATMHRDRGPDVPALGLGARSTSCAAEAQDGLLNAARIERPARANGIRAITLSALIREGAPIRADPRVNRQGRRYLDAVLAAPGGVRAPAPISPDGSAGRLVPIPITSCPAD